MEDIEKIKQLIIDNVITYLRIYEKGHEKPLYTISPRLKGDEEHTPETVSLKFEKGIKTLGKGVYKIIAKRYNTDSDAMSMVWNCNYSPSTQNIENANFKNIQENTHNQSIDIEELQNRAFEKALKYFQQEQEKRDFEEIKQRVKDQEILLESLAGKAAYVIEKIFTHFAPKVVGAVQSQVINSTQHNNTQNKVETNKFTQNEINEYNEALQILANFVSSENLLKIAKKVESNPKLLDMILLNL